ncbi:MAG: response regulator [Thermodesulfobacteriota bacterium]|nr:response regulator [Thermodesulfobacteriota bacterium]
MARMLELLFVDDEEDFVNYMTKRLERHDFKVYAYTNPFQAFQETEGKSFDVGLLDLKMPEMSGDELLNKLKTRDPYMEIIILTGHGSIESAFRSAQVGAYEYLLKPCDFDGLVASINKAYAKRIKTLSREKTSQVDDLMKNAVGMRPLELLKRIKNIHDGVEKYVSTAALTEKDASDAARKLMGKKSTKE